MVACPNTWGLGYTPLEEKEVLGRVNADIGHLAKAAQFPALTGYAPQSRWDAQKKESITTIISVAGVVLGLPQKSKHSTGAGSGEIAGGHVRYEATIGPRNLAPSGLMLTQPLQSFRCSLIHSGRRSVQHATCRQRYDILQGNGILDYGIEGTADLTYCYVCGYV